MAEYTLDQLCRLIDHTNLKAYADSEAIKALCEEAKSYHFKMVAINQTQTKLCAEVLSGTDIHVGAAIAFPLGQTTIAAKCFETKDAIANGADEIDYVINITELKDKNYAYIQEEMEAIVDICREAQVISKVIFENCYLTKDEIRKVAEIAREVKPDFIKTSTGFGTSGARVEDVRLMKEIVGDTVKVKAAGGIRDADSFLEMIAAGAERIGCSSGIHIIDELKDRLEREKIDKIEI
ncbi:MULTISPECIES: deoxyribose-phosphate aldolase [Aerococcus]|uniref:Deoxyribose-phosphate aldolase n=1 Tax=Aerococcus sanguinicola TaxID=119206 RepID=A0A5N1GLV6_9LACT|nr:MULTISPECIES: deoxyribose-phosphate aldolase [Aerococcus]KAA9301772.1 deoxyribose-phosphate aldolase [Aerococcus sanguinicola]MDK6368811.1 deoxyribose-phosphate aldolase [Aerococcus sp. UMB9870]MDK6679410.1 deoxyribose-phosphate aldolase [Aerococcus sp. UMB8608]MDK6685746.1 deoxyribose-phosphate aldolase [Aerococcus sp. UMB8623]MDK6939435.1 deoxyribose-phosphate aldolase [Aerococcus sp. UMB8487]